MNRHGKKNTGHSCREIVLSQNEAAEKIHKDLFSFDDTCYFIFGDRIIDSVLSAVREDLIKLHLSAGWENILKVALWTSEKPAAHDVISLIKKSGAADEELSPFKRTDINDIFPWLYYGKRFDILRRICNAAKAKAESKIEKKRLLVYCHLISDETGRIVASSL